MTRGFFTQEETRVRPHERKVTGCAACKLFKRCKSPKMKATGEGKAGILVVAEAPGVREDEQNTHLVSRVGKDFRKRLRRLGIDLDRDCRKINAVNCRPEKSRTPTPTEIECCRPMVWQEIKRMKPKVIILLGGAALQSVIGFRRPRDLGSINKWRGWCIPDHESGAWLCPIFHPSYLVQDDGRTGAERVFDADLKRIIQMVNKELPKNPLDKADIKVLKKTSHVCTYLETLLENKPMVAFDYETTGLKPDKKGHRIVTIAFSESPEDAVAFEYTPSIRSHLRAVLKDKSIRKIAANIAFEQRWGQTFLNCTTRRWKWDTVLAAHTLDNRRGVTSVKFQACVRFGVYDYDSHISPYLKGKNQRDANSFNRIDEVDIRELLTYNAYDSILEYAIALDQMKEITQ